MAVKKYNLLGREISYLTIISYNKEKYKWICKCACGKEVLRETGYLLRRLNGNKSCGCKAYNHGNRMPNFTAIKNKLLNGYKSGASRRQISFTLSKLEFENLLSKNCYYCDSLPNSKCSYVGYENDFLYNGIDRTELIEWIIQRDIQ